MKSNGSVKRGVVGGVVFLLVLASGVGPTAAAQTCVQPPEGLISWWPGDGSANDIVDGNSGTLENGTTFAPGMVGSAFSFDGIDDGVSILKASNLNLGASDFSIDAWVKVSQAKRGDIFVNYAGVPAYSLGVTASATATVRFRPGVQITGSVNDPFVEATGTKNLNDGQWHHLVGVRSGLDTALIYVDGVLDGSATNPAVLAVLGGSVNTGGCLYARMGAIHTGAAHCSSPTANLQEDHFAGLIDEVEIFNRALSATEIQAMFNAKGAGKCRASTGDALPTDVYAVKFLCGSILPPSGSIHPNGTLEGPVKPGNYLTAINVHNPNGNSIVFQKKAVLLYRADKPPGEPGEVLMPPYPFQPQIELKPDWGLEIDCADIRAVLLRGGSLPSAPPAPKFIKGWVVIEVRGNSPQVDPLKLDVTAVYTSHGYVRSGGAVVPEGFAEDVEPVLPKRVK